ncbi:MAG: DNA repair protein [Sphingomonas sp.]|nr:DNA repair protein [Sphingomonas sp.]
MIVDTARAAADLLRPLFADARGEKLAVAHLDAGRRLLALDEEVARGADSMALPVRDIIAAALARDAAGLVIAHNHPSGDPSPSPADIAATRRLAEAGERLDIRLHDHLIFAAGDCRSFRALGLL